MKKIYIVGIGPGSPEDITPAVHQVLREADVVVGYAYYSQFIQECLHEGAECIDTGMRQERERARLAIERAKAGQMVCVISSGGTGIYGMAPLLYEMCDERESDVELGVLPGISASQKAAALLGAPIGHDLYIISLSDLIILWVIIERRTIAAAEADFVTALYNPKSIKRYWQPERVRELFLKHRSPDTPVRLVQQAGRPDQRVWTTTLQELDTQEVDMFTVLVIGSSQNFLSKDKIVTPRGYYRDKGSDEEKAGQRIMSESSRTILSLLKYPESYSLDHLWAMLHAVHTTADFEMEELLYSNPNAVSRIYRGCVNGKIHTIVIDVMMAVSDIRKGALARYGIEVLCYPHDPRVVKMAERLDITRTQAGIRLAVEEHPDALYTFGNAPTVLMGLTHLIRQDKTHPAGVIAVPVDFVHVCESKHMAKPFHDTPKLVIEGRKRDSSLAATLVNATLSYDDAETLKPGRDL